MLCYLGTRSRLKHASEIEILLQNTDRRTGQVSDESNAEDADINDVNSHLDKYDFAKANFSAVRYTQIGTEIESVIHQTRAAAAYVRDCRDLLEYSFRPSASGEYFAKPLHCIFQLPAENAKPL